MSRIHDALVRAQKEKGERALPTKPTAVEVEKPVDPTEQAYERIVQAILATRGPESPKVILVLGSVRGEGASTVARDLARILGRDGSGRTLLVDANLHQPSQHVAFGVERSFGLSEVAHGAADLHRAVRNGFGPGLSLLTSGRPASSPTQLLNTAAMKRALSEMKSTFDLVILDGPPLTVYPEAASLVALSDRVILVVQAEHTRREVTEQAKKIVEESGGTILGAVLNRRRYHLPESFYRWL